ncbi:MAG: TolC family protein, partial [Nitrospinota bacterium]|nr:TolC family protein [Nitrospinota bacterium]
RGAMGRRAKSRFELEAAMLRLKKLERDVANEARDAAREVANGQQRIRAAAAARDLAEKKLEAEMSKFEEGASNSFNVLLYQQDLAAQRAREARAKVDYLVAKAMLARATGQTLEFNGISLGAAPR